jgi:hypothetical protein
VEVRARNREHGIAVGQVADAVDHRAHTAQRGRAERPTEHGAQMVLELTGDRALDRPVAAVVHSGRHFVGEEVAADVEQLDTADADVIERIQYRADARLGPPLERGIEPRRRRAGEAQDPADVGVLYRGPAHDRAVGPARRDDRQLALERHECFEDARHVAQMIERRGDVIG